MTSEKALSFLNEHGMSPDGIDPMREAFIMAEDMLRGLKNQESSLPMIPTYLSDAGQIPLGEPVAVIDAGGTNFRCALVHLEADGCHADQMRKWKMPGIDEPASWEEFIRFTADAIEPLMAETDKIGFCFSYSADITPEMDGKVQRIDKEVVITGCEGQLVGASLLKELERRGITGKKIVILNDTVAVLLGGLASGEENGSGCAIGQVSGTGTNTCCSLPEKRIEKLGRNGERRMVVNLESGMYTGMPRGDFDRELDRDSHNPGIKFFEKMTAGVYLGELCHRMLLAAAEEGKLSADSAEKVRALGWIDSAVIDAWSMGEKLEQITVGQEDADFVRTLCKAMFERSARCMCANLAAIAILSEEKTVSICAEGSLVQKSRVYRPTLERLLQEVVEHNLGRKLNFTVGYETTLAGSAAAALLNL